MGVNFKDDAGCRAAVQPATALLQVAGCLMIVASVTLSTVAQAEPAFARLYKQQYGYAPSCNACHKDGGGTPLNGYGEQFKSAGMNAAAFGKIARADADGDGASNEDEARARANPGSKHSTPSSKSDWLDTASLIPREVQAQFPSVTAYLPQDAILTAAEFTRARALGAELTAADENTIYIPLQDQRPVGTAMIFPVRYQGKDFFLLMTTDRQLNITAVKPMNTTHVPDAAKSPLYDRYKGMALDRLPAPGGSGLETAIGAAVKRAGTVIYVRLKRG